MQPRTSPLVLSHEYILQKCCGGSIQRVQSNFCDEIGDKINRPVKHAQVQYRYQAMYMMVCKPLLSAYNTVSIMIIIETSAKC